MPNSIPKWLRETTQLSNQFQEHFKANLRGVAESFAKHEHAEAVLVRHVEEAYGALARLGLISRRWYERTEFLSGAGGLLFGGAFALPDVLSAFMAESSWRTGATIGGMVAMMGVGGFLCAVGWIRGTIPQPR